MAEQHVDDGAEVKQTVSKPGLSCTNPNGKSETSTSSSGEGVIE